MFSSIVRRGVRLKVPAQHGEFPPPTNTVEGCHSQLRKVIKTMAAFLTPEAARKPLCLAMMEFSREWTTPIFNWTSILNQLAIRFEERMPA